MTLNRNGDLRLALYERIIFGLLGFLSLAALGVSSWALVKIVDHGEQLAGLQAWRSSVTSGAP